MTICEEVLNGFEEAKRDTFTFEASPTGVYHAGYAIMVFLGNKDFSAMRRLDDQMKNLSGSQRGREYRKAQSLLDTAHKYVEISDETKSHSFETVYMRILEAGMVHLTLAGYPRCAEEIGIDPKDLIQKIGEDLFKIKEKFGMGNALRIKENVLRLECAYGLFQKIGEKGY